MIIAIAKVQTSLPIIYGNYWRLRLELNVNVAAVQVPSLAIYGIKISDYAAMKFYSNNKSDNAY